MTESDIRSQENQLDSVKVPIRFKTEKGSEYEYFADGSGYVDRIKYDRSSHITRGVTVFLDEATLLEVSKMYADQSHLPKEKQMSWSLMEDYGDKGEYVWEPSNIHKPRNLIIAVINGNNVLKAKYPVSLIPQIGSYPFQQSIKDGKPNRHLGDKIVHLDTSQTLDIKLLHSK